MKVKRDHRETPFLSCMKMHKLNKKRIQVDPFFLTHKESQITNFSDSLAFYVCPCSLQSSPFLTFPSLKSFSHILLHYFVLPFFNLFQFYSIFAFHHFIFLWSINATMLLKHSCTFAFNFKSLPLCGNS